MCASKTTLKEALLSLSYSLPIQVKSTSRVVSFYVQNTRRVARYVCVYCAYVRAEMKEK
jgi:hypothetical protein